MLSTVARGLPDLVASKFYTTQTADLNDTIQANGQITNQGRGTANVPFHVGIYVSSSATAGRYAVKVGDITIPAGLGKNQSVPFNTTIKLPSSALPGMGSSNTLYVSLKVDPEKAVRESNDRNNQGVGLGYDISAVTIAPHAPAKLVGSTLSISSTDVVWGNTITVTAQIQNNGAGDAPATRARLVLTPIGGTMGGDSDVTIADLAIPAIAAYQSANIVQEITLPSIPPSDLSGGTSFALSLVEDADYITNQAYPHVVTQGTNLDQVGIRILPSGTTNPAPGPRADLAASTLTTSVNTLTWGQPLQVTTTIQNIGAADATQFRVFFLLVGASGSLNNSIFLGQAIVPGLKAGYDQQIVQSIQLPSRIPAGLSLNSVGKARIAVVVDPENVVDEPVKTNNSTQSAPMTLRILQTNGKSVAVATPTTPAKTANGKPRKLYHKAVKKTDNSVLHKLTVFPSDVGKFLKKYL
ncbi:MAG: hypothetical protein ABS79_05045 [Planctomycetes bacterium SCN 63-9]|nr:MAG: hypothetical protein ABS79_05045 [Planctomycetes bacterium SCN 63-9]